MIKARYYTLTNLYEELKHKFWYKLYTAFLFIADYWNNQNIAYLLDDAESCFSLQCL